MGHMTRANSEDCLFAVRGKLPARMDASICQHVTAPRMENSRKPDVIREKLVQLLGDVPRIELFARQSSHGFDVWGNQCTAPAVELLPLRCAGSEDGGRMNIAEEASLIRQLEEARAIINQRNGEIIHLQREAARYREQRDSANAMVKFLRGLFENSSQATQ